jgi:hypothetical protein
MFKKTSPIRAHLDRMGKVVLRAASADDAVIGTAAESPYLLTRIRARINEQQNEANAGSFFSLFLIARRAVPALALITLLTVILTLMLLASGTQNSVARFDEDTFFDTRGNSLPGAVLANREGLTGDDVFSIVVDRNDRGGAK